MKSGLFVFLIVAALVGLAGIWYVGTYNSLIAEREQVNQTWGQVQNVYQRRADLVPNLVATVQGYAKHERETFQLVTEARSKVGSVNVSAAGLAASVEAQKEFLSAQQTLGGALSRLIAVSESYPNLKANDNFRDLQSQLEGTENRIAVERKRNQEAIQAYNTHVQAFFASFVAQRNQFTKAPYFEAQPGSDKAPQVKF